MNRARLESVLEAGGDEPGEMSTNQVRLETTDIDAALEAGSSSSSSSPPELEPRERNENAIQENKTVYSQKESSTSKKLEEDTLTVKYMPLSLYRSPEEASRQRREADLEAQVQIIEHIRKNLTLFESSRQVYREEPTQEVQTRGHLQSLLEQRQQQQQASSRVQFESASFADQYTQYRASDLDYLESLDYGSSDKNYKRRPLPPIARPRLQQQQQQQHQLSVEPKAVAVEQSSRGDSSRTSLSKTLNHILKRPLKFVAGCKSGADSSDQRKREISANSGQSSEPEKEQYKVPVQQTYTCSQSLFLLPEPDYTVHIATRSIKDILLAHQRAKQKAALAAAAKSQLKRHDKTGPASRQDSFKASESRLLLLLGSYTLGRQSQRSNQAHSASLRRRSRSLVPSSSGQQERARRGSLLLENSVGVGRIKAKVRMPSGKSDRASVVDNKDGTVKISYEPKEVGQHEIVLRYNEEPLDESPVVFYVDAIGSAKKKVTAYGPALTRGRSGEPCKFTINTGGLGSSKLHVSVDGPSKSTVNLQDNKDGTISVSYVPLSAGEYKIKISFDGKQVLGSPFSAQVSDEGRQRSRISVGRASEHSLDLKIAEQDLKSLDAVISTPCGLEEPCLLKLLKDGQLAIVFTPREQGDHSVAVRRRGNHIAGSPFKFAVLSRDIGDAKQVKVSGKALKEAKTNVENELLVNTKDAGFGGLSVALEGPGRSEIASKDVQDGLIKLALKTPEPGQYSLIVKYADHAVPGSPFDIKVTGQGSNLQREVLKKFRRQVEQVDANTEAHFSFKLPGVSAYDLSARIHSPQMSAEDVSIIDKGDFVYQVTFTPKEVGLYSLSVRNKDIHLAGSPFPFTVGPPIATGPHRVRCGGSGLLRGTCGKPNGFDVFTREAGPGELTAIVEGPSKPELTYTDRKDGSCHISYKVSEPGAYRISILYNDQEVPDSPFRAYVMPVTGDVSKIELGPMPPESMIQLNKPCNLTVIMNGAKGNIEGQVQLPSGVKEECFASPIDAENWGVRFIPRELGIHKVHIKFNKGSSHIPQSPILIRVGHDKADPAQVVAHGNGLKGATVNQATDFTVETCQAGHGLLEVNIEGPSKVSMACAELDEGYRVSYTPLAPGDYIVSVKYNGCHIGQSPFKVRALKQAGAKTIADLGSHEISTIAVSTSDREARHKVENMPKFKSEVSRVYCKGMGLKKAFANKPNTLTVNCSEAGFNLISVSFLGPTRNTIHECAVKHLGGSIYEVRYTCKDKGDAILIVKYGDEQIPGSPFRLECV